MLKKVDGNQRQIVRAVRAMGATVQVLSEVGKGFPDIIIGCNGYNVLIEIKNDEQSASNQRLTVAEKRFHNSWNGEIYIIRNIEEAINLINHVRLRDAVKRLL